MHKSVFIPIILVAAVTLFSCAGKNNNGQPGDATFKVFQIVTISPYGCYQEIEFTSSGDGYLKSGLYSSVIKDDNLGLDTLFSVDSFYVQKQQDLKNIRRTITSILGTENIKGGAKADAYRHKLIVDGVNKIDTYGLSKDLQELLKQMINYLPLSNDKCEFFELFKKSMQSEHQ